MGFTMFAIGIFIGLFVSKVLNNFSCCGPIPDTYYIDLEVHYTKFHELLVQSHQNGI